MRRTARDCAGPGNTPCSSSVDGDWDAASAAVLCKDTLIDAPARFTARRLLGPGPAASGKGPRATHRVGMRTNAADMVPGGRSQGRVWEWAHELADPLFPSPGSPSSASVPQVSDALAAVLPRSYCVRTTTTVVRNR